MTMVMVKWHMTSYINNGSNGYVKLEGKEPIEDYHQTMQSTAIYKASGKDTW